MDTAPKLTRNAISVDVEEYFHATNLAPVAPRPRWPQLPSRVVDSTLRLLDLFAEYKTKGTFFILGWTARRHPELVKRIADAGHEVASHGYGHFLVYNQSPSQFRRDTRISKQVLEDILGKEVVGYRAANFSIRKENEWAYDELIELGFEYDSSCYPVWHPRYKNLERPLVPFLVQRDVGTIVVYPLAVRKATLGNVSLRLPIAGGAYWRLFPLWYSQGGLRSLAKDAEGRAICYLHPWEFDTEQPKFNELSLLTKIRHYGGVAGLERKMRALLQEFEFTSIREASAGAHRIENIGEQA